MNGSILKNAGGDSPLRHALRLSTHSDADNYIALNSLPTDLLSRH